MRKTRGDQVWGSALDMAVLGHTQVNVWICAGPEIRPQMPSLHMGKGSISEGECVERNQSSGRALRPLIFWGQKEVGGGQYKNGYQRRSLRQGLVSIPRHGRGGKWGVCKDPDLLDSGSLDPSWWGKNFLNQKGPSPKKSRCTPSGGPHDGEEIQLVKKFN